MIISRELWRHRWVWEERNPCAVLEAPTGPWTPAAPDEAEPLSEAGIVAIDELGSDAAAAIRWAAARLQTSGTLTLFVAEPNSAEALRALHPVLRQCGLVVDRQIGSQSPGSHAIMQFRRSGRQVHRLRITGRALKVDAEPLGRSVVRVRLGEPFDHLNSFPDVTCRVLPSLAIPDVPDRDATDILIIQRRYFLNPAALDAIAARHYIAVLEIDDLPMPTKELSIDVCHANIARFHAVQTSTAALAEYARRFNPEVKIFGNHLSRFRKEMPVKRGKPLRVAFAALNREAGWREIVGPYRDVVRSYGDAVFTTVMGDKKFFDELQPLNSSFVPAQQYPDYLAELDRSDIALLPLAPNKFDRCKTDLKFIECAEAGTTVLASHIVYGETVRSGETGFVYRTVDDFRRQLCTLLDDAPTRKRLAANARDYVREHRMLAPHISDRFEWYQALAARRDELEQRRRERASRM